MKRKYIAAAGAAAVFILAVLMTNRNQNSQSGDMPVSTEITETEIVPEPETTKVPETEAELPNVLEISAAEQAILKELWKHLENRDYEAAARVLNDNEEQLQIFFYTTLEAGDWFYDGTQLTDTESGSGLVFRRPTAVFYGNIENGCPQGAGIALQAVRMQAGRYDYVAGVWKDGKLEGEGINGYRYYEQPDEEVLLEVKKEGRFHENLMNGTVTYTSVNRDGELSKWTIEVQEGVTVLNDSWTFKDDKQEYQLPADDDDTHVYVLPEKQAGQVIWKNLLEWE